MEIKKTVDNTRELKQGLQNLVSKEVIIGITNSHYAQEAYLTEYGEGLLNIPPNPFFFEGIDKAKNSTVSIMKKGALDILLNRNTIQNVLSNVGENEVDSIVQEGIDKNVSSSILNHIDYLVV